MLDLRGIGSGIGHIGGGGGGENVKESSGAEAAGARGSLDGGLRETRGGSAVETRESVLLRGGGGGSGAGDMRSGNVQAGRIDEKIVRRVGRYDSVLAAMVMWISRAWHDILVYLQCEDFHVLAGHLDKCSHDGLPGFANMRGYISAYAARRHELLATIVIELSLCLICVYLAAAGCLRLGFRSFTMHWCLGGKACLNSGLQPWPILARPPLAVMSEVNNIELEIENISLWLLPSYLDIGMSQNPSRIFRSYITLGKHTLVRCAAMIDLQRLLSELIHYLLPLFNNDAVMTVTAITGFAF
ncbi:hypothetical protein Tco_0685806 [Tanacetum coccineum]